MPCADKNTGLGMQKNLGLVCFIKKARMDMQSFGNELYLRLLA